MLPNSLSKEGQGDGDMLTMETRKEVTKVYSRRYARAGSKKEKGAILDEVCEMTGWHRKHAIRVLSGKASPAGAARGRRGPKPKYGVEHRRVVGRVWAILDFPCSKRLKAGMRDVVEALRRSGHDLGVSGRVEREVCEMSASTLDRMLAHDREAMAPKGRSTTKPGSFLKSQIPIRRGRDWDDAALGFMEIDTVAHGGGSARGEFCFTLDATDVASGWTELRAVRNKAEVHTLGAMRAIRERMPFELLGIDSDNGSEFINAHFLRYCEAEGLVFTRGRPYTKNDGCFVEEKNWSVVRRVVGYARYEGDEACALLNDIYDRQRILANYFMPSQKLVSKTRDGARVVRFHDDALTPYRRIMKMRGVGKAARDRMRSEFKSADPLALRLEVHELTQRLLSLAVPL